jgi:hypothetical protein
MGCLQSLEVEISYRKYKLDPNLYNYEFNRSNIQFGFGANFTYPGGSFTVGRQSSNLPYGPISNFRWEHFRENDPDFVFVRCDGYDFEGNLKTFQVSRDMGPFRNPPVNFEEFFSTPKYPGPVCVRQELEFFKVEKRFLESVDIAAFQNCLQVFLEGEIIFETCSDASCQPPDGFLECNPTECPEGTCPCLSAGQICCYDANGIAIKQIPIKT